jgi:hypothetical protein
MQASRDSGGPWPEWLVTGMFLAITLILTYPIVFQMGRSIFGYPPDARYYIWLAWWRKYSLLHDLDFYFLSLSQAPFGTDYAFRSYPGLITCLGLLSIPFGEIGAYNLMILVAFSLSGVFAYLLARQLVHSRLASFAAGLVFAFSPYAYTHTQYHVDLAQQWVLPLFMLALLRLYRRRTVFSALLLGAAFALTAYMEAYYAFYAAIAALTFAVVEMLIIWKGSGIRVALAPRRMALYGMATLAGLALYLPELIPVLRTFSAQTDNPLRTGMTFARAEAWFFLSSSRPWNFLLPPEGHPLFGTLTHRAYRALSQLQSLEFAPPAILNRYPFLEQHWFWKSADRASRALYLVRQCHISRMSEAELQISE